MLNHYDKTQPIPPSPLPMVNEIEELHHQVRRVLCSHMWHLSDNEFDFMHSALDIDDIGEFTVRQRLRMKSIFRRFSE